MPDPMILEVESDFASPYRADGKLYGFVCVVTGASMPVGGAIVTELAGMLQKFLTNFFIIANKRPILQLTAQRASTPVRRLTNPQASRPPSQKSTPTPKSSTIPTPSPPNKTH